MIIDDIAKELSSELQIVGEQLKTIVNGCFELERKLNEIWINAIHGIEKIRDFEITIKHKKYWLKLFDDKLLIVIGKDICIDCSNKEEGIFNERPLHAWEIQDFIEFLENLEEILNDWLNQLRELRKRISNEKMLEALDKLDLVLYILK